MQPSFSSIISSAAVASSLSSGIPQSLADFANIWSNTGVVPDAIPPLTGPIQPLGLSLSNIATPFTVGQAYPLAATAPIPTYSLDPSFAAPYAAANTTFVLMFVDPDTLTPQQKELGPSRHYIAPNYHVDATGLLTNSTPAISEYFGPLPPPGSFPHRYSHLLFVQPPGFEQAARSYLNGSDLVLLPDISNLPMFLLFNSTKFIQSTGLGSPVAGTFIMSAPDGVPTHSTAGQQISFTQAGIVPSVIPSFDPIAIFDPFFPVNGTTFLARSSENVSATNVIAAPQFLLSFNSSVAPQVVSKTYVAIGMDLDATTPMNLHHLASDLTISSSLNTFAPLVNSTPALVEWTAPAYVPGPAHRNLYLLFEQPVGFTQAAAPLASPKNFNLASFIQATGLGAPLGGMYFNSGLNLTLQ